MDFFLNKPNLKIEAFGEPSSFVVFTVAEGSIVEKLRIHGTPEQFRAAADEICKAFPKPENLNQTTADDEAARDFELLREARKNTPNNEKEVAA